MPVCASRSQPDMEQWVTELAFKLKDQPARGPAWSGRLWAGIDYVLMTA